MTRPSLGGSFRARSLGNKLLLFAAALILVPGMLLTGIAERSGRESLQRVIGLQLAREAENTANRLSAVLRAERETLASFARQDLMREIRVADIDKRVSGALATLRDGSPLRVDYLVADRERRVVASSEPRLLGSLPEWVDAGWVKGTPDGYLVGPLTFPKRGIPGLVLSSPIADPDDADRVLGTLVALLDWDELTAVTRHVRDDLVSQGIAADVLVSRSDGTVIGGARSSKTADSSRPADLSGVAKEAPAAKSDYAVDEVAGLIIGRASLADDLPDWKLLVIERRSDALAPARRLSHHLVLTMGLALIAALALATLAARRVVRPLSELTRAVRGLSRGDATPVEVRTEDEVGILAGAFNEMASELQQAQRELVEAEKFAFVGELAAGVAHEIRTALGVLGSSTQILERYLPEDADPEVAELAQLIRAEVGRLAGIVNDLLTLDRARPPQLEAERISEPLLRALEFVGHQAQAKGIRLDFAGVPEEEKLLLEPELLYQVAVNLLVNAIQAVASGGRVEVEVLGVEEGYGGFEVRDDGPGIPAELRDRIFQPFVTAREGGVGLGLTFVKRVVHDHRGVVRVESQHGSGTRVRVWLPAAGESR